MLNIKFFETSSGRSPIEEWLDSLKNGNINDLKLLRSIIFKMDLLENMGAKLGKPHCDCLTSGRRLAYHIYELRIPFNNNTYRIFYSFYNEDIVVLLHWVHKKTQKVEKSDIDLSIGRMKKWVIKNG